MRPVHEALQNTNPRLHRRGNGFLRLCLWCMLACTVSLSVAQENFARDWLEAAREEISVDEKAIAAADNSLRAFRGLSGARKRLVAIHAQARACIDENSASLASLQERRAALGASTQGENTEVISLRRELEGEIGRVDKRRVDCEQIAQVANDLLESIARRENAELKARLFARGMSALRVVDDAVKEPQAWSRLVSGFLDEGSGWERLSFAQKWTIVPVVVLALLAGLLWRRRLSSQRRLSVARRLLVPASPWLLAVGMACVLFLAYLPVWPPELITRLALGILAWQLLGLLLHFWLLGRRAAGLSAEDAGSLLMWLRILSGLLLAGATIITAEAVIQLPDTHYFLLRTGMAWLMFVGVLWSALLLGHVPGLAGTRGPRVLMVLVVFAIAIAETTGFRNLSLYLLVGCGGSAAGYAVAELLTRLATFFYDSLDEGRYAWQRVLRTSMDLKAKEPVPGLVWLRLASTLLIWSAFVVWTLRVWGQSERWIARITQYFTAGFDAGSLHIEPFRILGAIAALAIGITLSRWIKQSLIADLVKRSRLDRGGREAIVTLSGYVGVVISLLIALGIAGISYTHLAIIAGALSVGIGFGLQNVVNNFVSGLILLFERPIRTGDWIVVGDTQGYVRRISIRSTQIETFDRADVIVPNSELIANRVANWMLRDPWGRITIPVGVAYGSNVEQVIAILLEVAGQHDGVLRDQPGVPPPKALFRRFGDSALEFELRCFIRQIDRVFDITHDINMSIDRRFREAGVTIPFPQRDVHLKPASEGGT